MTCSESKRFFARLLEASLSFESIEQGWATSRAPEIKYFLDSVDSTVLDSLGGHPLLYTWICTPLRQLNELLAQERGVLDTPSTSSRVRFEAKKLKCGLLAAFLKLKYNDFVHAEGILPTLWDIDKISVFDERLLLTHNTFLQFSVSGGRSARRSWSSPARKVRQTLNKQVLDESTAATNPVGGSTTSLSLDGLRHLKDEEQDEEPDDCCRDGSRSSSNILMQHPQAMGRWADADDMLEDKSDGFGEGEVQRHEGEEASHREDVIGSSLGFRCGFGLGIGSSSEELSVIESNLQQWSRHSSQSTTTSASPTGDEKSSSTQVLPPMEMTHATHQPSQGSLPSWENQSAALYLAGNKNTSSSQHETEKVSYHQHQQPQHQEPQHQPRQQQHPKNHTVASKDTASGRWWLGLPDVCPISQFPVIKTMNLSVLGKDLSSGEIRALDYHLKHCKLGPFRIQDALRLQEGAELSQEMNQELKELQAKATRRLIQVVALQRRRKKRDTM